MNLRHPSGSLPRSSALTDLITSDATMPERLDGGLRRVLASKIAMGAPARSFGNLRLDSYSALEMRRAPSAARIFAWSPHTARRILGAPAARRVITAAASSPLAAVRTEIADVIARSASARVRPGSLGAWLAEAPHGVVAAVTASATEYATELTTLLDYRHLGTRVELGRADPIWAVPGAPWVTLRARRDVEVALDADHQTRALVALRPGRPTALATDDLGLVALVEALTRPEAPLPTRVVGIWPSSGKAVSLEVSQETCRRAARLVVDAVEAKRQRVAIQHVA